MPAQIDIDGHVHRVDDLTIDEIIQVEKETGQSWAAMQNVLHSAAVAKSVIVRLLARDTGEAAATKRVGDMTMEQLFDCVSPVDDDLPSQYKDGIPSSEGAPATTGSSGAPSSSDGPPTLSDASKNETSGS